MNFFKPTDLNNLFELIGKIDGRNYFLAGGSDINVQIKNKMITNDNIIYINNLMELQGIKENNDNVVLGALTTFKQIITSSIIQDNFPLLSENLQNFASPLIQTSATIGGNIANGSPTADIMPLLMVLDAEIIITGKDETRQININKFYHGYKQNALKPNEIIKEIWLKKDIQKDAETFYQKVGARKTLTIAKVSLAGLKKIENESIKEIHLAAGSLNEFARRLPKLEKYITGKKRVDINLQELETILAKEITPISDLRSNKDYRFQVCLNLIKTFLEI